MVDSVTPRTAVTLSISATLDGIPVCCARRLLLQRLLELYEYYLDAPPALVEGDDACCGSMPQFGSLKKGILPATQPLSQPTLRDVSVLFKFKL